MARCASRNSVDRDRLLNLAGRANGFQELVDRARMHLHMSFRLVDLDGADVGFCDVAGAAQHREQPAGLGTVGAANRQAQPDPAFEIVPTFARLVARPPVSAFRTVAAVAPISTLTPVGPFVAFTTRRAVQQFLRCRQPSHPLAQKGDGNRLGVVARQQLGRERALRLGGFPAEVRILQNALPVQGQDLIGRRGLAPACFDARIRQQAFGMTPAGVGHDQGRHTFASGAAGSATPMQERFRILRQIGVNHQFQVRQIDPARRHIRRDTDLRTTVPQRLKRMGPGALAQLA